MTGLLHRCHMALSRDAIRIFARRDIVIGETLEGLSVLVLTFSLAPIFNHGKSKLEGGQTLLAIDDLASGIAGWRFQLAQNNRPKEMRTRRLASQNCCGNYLYFPMQKLEIATKAIMFS